MNTKLLTLHILTLIYNKIYILKISIKILRNKNDFPKKEHRIASNLIYLKGMQVYPNKD